MQSYFFWRQWTQEYRYLMYFLLSLCVLSMGFMWAEYFIGVDGVIHWQNFQDQRIIDSIIDTFSLGPFEFNVPAENFVIFEFFNGSSITPNFFAAYGYLFVFFFASALIITVVTTLPRFWFIVGTVLFILYIYSLRLDVLGLWGNYDGISTLILSIIVAAISACYNIFKPQTPFSFRLFSYLLLFAIAGFLISQFAQVKYPLFHLVVTSYPVALIITVLFILLVAHEIIAGFVRIIGKGVTGSKNLTHFTVICFIYLGNVFVVALHEIDILHWNFIYINIYLLLTVSVIIGFWGFRSREILYDNIMPFSPVGAFLYMGLALIALTTTGNLLGNNIDTGLRVIRQLTVFSHFGFGFIFFIYILANFISLLGKNLDVSKVLYKPTNMPYFTFQFAGLIATLGFIFYVGWRIIIFEGISGFYTQLGDLDLQLGDRVYANGHYKQARQYSVRNHHANYALGRLHDNFLDLSDMHRYYATANFQTPSLYSVINEANTWLWEKNYFEAIKRFEEGFQLFPASGYIQNNVGFAYSKIFSIDSASYYFSKARSHTKTKDEAEANFFALATQEHIPIQADSVLRYFNSTYPGTIANALALANTQQQNLSTTTDPMATKTFDLYSATLLNNYLIQNVKSLDTAFLNQALELANDSTNSDYSEALKVAIAAGYYYGNNFSKTLYIMGELAYISQSYGGKYNYLLGLWSLKQGNYERAARYFRFAEMQDYKEATLYKAISLTEDAQFDDAMIAWDSVAVHSEEESEIAQQIKSVISISSKEIFTHSDSKKYQYCRYRIEAGDTVLFDKLINTITDHNYKAQALLEMAQQQFNWGNHLKAISYLNQTSGLKLNSKKLFNAIRYFELSILAERKDLQQLANSINEGITFDREHQLDKLLYTALLYETNKDTLEAVKCYAILAVYNPYFEEGVIAAANYYKHHSIDNLKGYTILAEALQVNNVSPKLLLAYIKEATELGFDEYAIDAMMRLKELSVKSHWSLE